MSTRRSPYTSRRSRRVRGESPEFTPGRSPPPPPDQPLSTRPRKTTPSSGEESLEEEEYFQDFTFSGEVFEEDRSPRTLDAAWTSLFGSNESMAQERTSEERAKERLDSGLKRLEAITASLDREGQIAQSRAHGFALAGDEAAKARAELALKDLISRFDRFVEVVRECESYLAVAGYGDNEAQDKQKLLSDAYRRESENFIQRKVEIDKNVKIGRNKQGALEGVGNDKLFKLPTLSLPTFSGDIREFPSFQRNFEDMIGKTGLRNFQKLIHLRQALKGPVANLVDSCGEGDDAYEEAWRILIGRYGDKDVLRTMLLNEVQEVSPVRSNMSVPEQQKTHDKVRKLFLRLITVDPQADEPTSPMLPIIQGKYSADLRREIEKEFGMRLQVSKFLEEAERILRREGRFAATDSKAQRSGGKEPRQSTAAFIATNATTSGKSGGGSGQAKGPEPNKGKATGAQALGGRDSKARKSSKQAKKQSSCLYCTGNHFVWTCPKFRDLSIEGRRRVTKERQWCPKCLNPMHKEGVLCSRREITCKAKKPNNELCGSTAHNWLLHH